MGLFDFDNLRKSILSSDDEEKVENLERFLLSFLYFIRNCGKIKDI